MATELLLLALVAALVGTMIVSWQPQTKKQVCREYSYTPPDIEVAQVVSNWHDGCSLMFTLGKWRMRCFTPDLYCEISNEQAVQLIRQLKLVGVAYLLGDNGNIVISWVPKKLKR